MRHLMLIKTIILFFYFLLLSIDSKLLAQDYLRYLKLGISQAEAGNYPEAIDNFNKSLELNPNNSFTYYNLGTAKGKGIGDMKAAILDFDKAIILNPNYALAYNNRANAKKNLGDSFGALQDYSTAIKIDPNYSFFLLAHLVVLFLDDYED